MYYLKTGIWMRGDVPYVLALQSIAISLYYEPYLLIKEEDSHRNDIAY